MECPRKQWKPKTYKARYLPNAQIVVDGLLDELAWRQASIEQRFMFPWPTRVAPLTEFRALYDEQSFFFSFRVDDEDIVVVEDFYGKEAVMSEDRVELFFALEENLEQYFCLEVDPLGRTLDYKASYHRKFDFSWRFPGLRVASKIHGDGYVVEGLIPLKSLEGLGLPSPDSGRPIKFGIFRAEFSHGEAAAPIEDWISWGDPSTEEPDFHVPSAFGYLDMAK